MKTYKIKDNVYILEDSVGCCTNLVLGLNKALVFDTGTGFDNLYEEIRKITSLDLIVINSHGHFDHIGGNDYFEKVYIHSDDYDLHKSGYTNGNVRTFMADYYEKQCDNDFFSRGWGNFFKIDFDSFDLGNLYCEIKHMPGHTKGSIGVLIPSLKLLLSGDTLSPSICLNFPNSLSVEELLDTYNQIKKYEFDEYLTSHHTHAFKKKYIYFLENCCKESMCCKGYKYVSPINPTYNAILYIYCDRDPIYSECISIIK
ncbi:MAG: MBL fold metallo-hydrolase [Bacilli bacterium]|nr:MBL fold metallo-hydrolase [Bacilli bacterium]